MNSHLPLPHFPVPKAGIPKSPEAPGLEATPSSLPHEAWGVVSASFCSSQAFAPRPTLVARPFPAPSRPGSAPSRSPTSLASGWSLRLRVRPGAEVGARGGRNAESGGRYSQWEAAMASGCEAGPARVLGSREA